MQYKRILNVTVVVSMAFVVSLLLGISFVSADDREDRDARADRTERITDHADRANRDAREERPSVE